MRSAVAIALAAIGACSSTPGTPSEPERAAPAAIQSHRDDGFALEAPAAWSVSATPEGRVVLDGPADDRVVLVPLFAAGALDAASAGAVLVGLTGDLFDRATGDAVMVSDRAVRRTGRDPMTFLAWTPTERGSAGLAVAASTSDVDIVATILESFRVLGPPVEERAAPSWATWRDPTEGAFTVEIPAGWAATGGMVRPCPVILQGAVEVRSPDGIYLKYGSDYPYFVNDVAGAQLGLGVGDTWSQPCGYQSPVAPYAPGAEFVLSYLAPQVPGVEILDVRDRSDLAAALPTGGLVSYDAGEVEYRYPGDGGAVRGTVLAITEQTTIGAIGTWDVWRILIAEGPEPRYADALAAGVHLAQSFRFDPVWAEAQARLTAAQSAILAEANDAISRTISDGYWSRQAVNDVIFERQSMATLGVEDYVDPTTGDVHRLDAGPTHYWADPSGEIVGTDTAAAPDVDFRELLLVER